MPTAAPSRPTRTALLVLIAVVAGLALSVARADAATVTGSISQIKYTAAPGEANNVKVEYDWFDWNKLHVHDSGAVISVGDGCRSVDIHHATCPWAVRVVVDAGDGDDVVHGIRELWIDGGPGDDELYNDWGGIFTADRSYLTGGEGNDRLVGQGRDDELRGGPGDDVLRGESGEDLIDGGDGADDLAGGWDTDTVTYQGHSPAVTLWSGVEQWISGNDADGPPGARDLIRNDVEKVVGTPGNDTIHGSYNNDVLSGLDGNDVLYGYPGNDVLEGGNGTDTLSGMMGDDTERGDGGNDTFQAAEDGRDDYQGGDGSDTVSYWYRTTSGVTANLNGAADDGPGGEDTIRTDVENLEGTNFPDQLTGDDRPNVLTGNYGNDRLYGYGADDELRGGDSSDELYGHDGNDLLDGAGGADSLLAAGGDDVLIPGEGSTDVAYGGDGVDRVTYAGRTDGVELSPDDQFNDGRPGEGDDIGSDVEQLTGGLGPDRLYGNSAANVLDGGAGDDYFKGGAGADAITGSAGSDTADYGDRTEPLAISLNTVADDGTDADRDGVGEEGDNVHPSTEKVVAGSGPDRVTGGPGGFGGNDLDGRGGDDVLTGGDGNDVLRGGDGTDTLAGAAGGDRLNGDASGDRLDGGGDGDLLDAGPGNDRLTGGTGADDLQGGAGSDTASYTERAATEPVTVDIDSETGDDGGAADSTAAIRDTVRTDVEHVSGGAGADRLTGTAGPNTLRGGNGGDVLIGDGGADGLLGGAGRDELTGGPGADTLEGGSGSDLVLYSERFADEPVAVTIGAGTRDDGGAPDGAPGARDDVAADVERVTGGASADTLVGSDAANTLTGGSGDDSLRGLAGTDTLAGGLGDDTLDTVDSTVDRSYCGKGIDRVLADPIDILASDCDAI